MDRAPSVFKNSWSKPIQSDEPQDLTLIQARYKALQQLIEEEHEKEKNDSQKDMPKVPLLNPSASEGGILL